MRKYRFLVSTDLDLSPLIDKPSRNFEVSDLSEITKNMKKILARKEFDGVSDCLKGRIINLLRGQYPYNE